MTERKKPAPLSERQKPAPLSERQKPAPLSERRKPAPLSERQKPAPLSERQKPAPLSERQKSSSYSTSLPSSADEPVDSRLITASSELGFGLWSDTNSYIGSESGYDSAGDWLFGSDRGYVTSVDILQFIDGHPRYIQVKLLHVSSTSTEELDRFWAALACVALAGGAIVSIVLTAGAATPAYVVLGATVSGALMAGAFAGTHNVITADKFEMSVWCQNVSVAAAAGAAGGLVGSGVAVGAAAIELQALLAGALSGVCGSMAGTVTTNVLTGQDLHKNLLAAALAGAFGGVVGAAGAELLRDEIMYMRHILVLGAAGSVGGTGGEVLRQWLSGEGINLEAALQAAMIGAITGVLSGMLSAKMARERAVEEILASKGAGMAGVGELAEKYDARVEFVDPDGKVHVFNSGGRTTCRIQLERSPNGDIGHATLSNNTWKDVHDDYCMERAFFRGRHNKDPSLQDVKNLRSEWQTALRPKVKNVLGELYPKFKNAERYGKPLTYWRNKAKAQQRATHGADMASTSDAALSASHFVTYEINDEYLMQELPDRIFNLNQPKKASTHVLAYGNGRFADSKKNFLVSGGVAGSPAWDHTEQTLMTALDIEMQSSCMEIDKVFKVDIVGEYPPCWNCLRGRQSAGMHRMAERYPNLRIKYSWQDAAGQEQSMQFTGNDVKFTGNSSKQLGDGVDTSHSWTDAAEIYRKIYETQKKEIDQM